MIDLMLMFTVFLAGLLLGGFFFGGLMWTVKRGLMSKRPALWFISSWIVRLAVALVTFYLLFDGQWERLLVCVAGFLVARIILVRLVRTGDPCCASIQEAEDAS